MFGFMSCWEHDTRYETETEKLKRELAEAEATIKRLREMLGSNHPSGRGGGGVTGLFG